MSTARSKYTSDASSGVTSRKKDAYFARGERAQDGGHRGALGLLTVLVLVILVLIERGEAQVRELDRCPGSVVLQLVREGCIFYLEVTLGDDDLWFARGQHDTPTVAVSVSHTVHSDAYQGAIATTMTLAVNFLKNVVK